MQEKKTGNLIPIVFLYFGFHILLPDIHHPSIFQCALRFARAVQVQIHFAKLVCRNRKRFVNGDRLAGFQRINVIVPPLAAANILGDYFSRQHQAFLHDIVQLIACSGCFQFPMPYARPVAFGLQKLD